MGFRINTNVASLNAQNNANLNSRALDNSLARLSSGL
ncbi:flagellin, partial [Campylobacter sp. CNRCH_2014_0184h]|nr:flagellin [Campylobacter sp. CNRCH_2014_0184h]